MSDFFKAMLEDMDDDDTYVADTGLHSGELTGTVDTGSYMLNALCSGSIFGGCPANKIAELAGEPATGKTFFALGIVKQFLLDHPDGAIIYYDTEAAVSKGVLKDRGIDPARVIFVEKSTVEDFRTHASQILTKYMEAKVRPPMLMVLDSLGMLSTKKEMGDMESGTDKRDMTKAVLVKGAFRALSLKLAKAGVPLLVTNHTYDKIGSMYPVKVSGGGSGLTYAASQRIFLSKRKDKDDDGVNGVIIHCKLEKSRFTKEYKMIDVRLSYTDGLDRYYGLIDLAEKYKIFKKSGTRYELDDGSKVFGKTIMDNPEKYFTKEILERLDEAAGIEFKYGSAEVDTGEPATEGGGD